jgi:hypothetical protein
MKLTLIAVSAVSVAVLAGCSSAASSSSAAAANPAPAATAKTLAPLVLGHFPDTTDGKLAREVCEQWQGLRQEYVYRLTIDSPNQMNGWFSSSAWSKEYAESNELGNDPAYTQLEASLGVATVGEDASDANAGLVDKACEKAD